MGQPTINGVAAVTNWERNWDTEKRAKRTKGLGNNRGAAGQCPAGAALLLGALGRGFVTDGDVNGAGCNSEDHGDNNEDGLGEMHFVSAVWSEARGLAVCLVCWWWKFVVEV